jgi:hypothetical protein
MPEIIVEGGGEEKRGGIERAVFEKPKELADLEREVAERTRGVIMKISGEEIAFLPSSEERVPEEEGWSERRIKVETQRLQNRLRVIEDIERVIDVRTRAEKSTPEAIAKFKQNIQEAIRKIATQKAPTSFIGGAVESLSEERLNKLRWFELEKLGSILEKVARGEPLDHTETGLLRFCAYFPLEEEGVKSASAAGPGLGLESSPPESPPGSSGSGPSAPRPEAGPPPGPETAPEKTTLELGSRARPRRPGTAPEPPPAAPEERVEEQILSVEDARRSLEEARREVLARYEEYIRAQRELRRARDDRVRLDLERQLHNIKLMLDNAERLRRLAQEKYKLATYFDLVGRKKEYLAGQLRNQIGDALRNRIRSKNPDLTPEEVEQLVNQEIQAEAERLFQSEKEAVDKEVLASIAYDILRQEEEFEEQKLNVVRQENERRGGVIRRLWERYRALSFGSRAALGALIAGVSAGALAAAGGAGFAALGIGTAYAGRRFFGGAVVGGSIKGIADRLIARRERRQLDESTRKQVDQITQEVASVLNNPEKAPQNQEQWLKVMKHLDSRLDGVLEEREQIRNRNDKSRRRWTLVAILVGGLAGNIDNLKALGSKVITEPPVPPVPKPPPGSEFLPSRPFGPAYLPLPNIPQGPDVVGLTMAPVGRGGFWEAALQLKQTLGLSDEEFGRAWSLAKVVDPLSGREIPLPQAHFVAPLAPEQHMVLAYNSAKHIFEPFLGPKVKVGGAEELIAAWRKSGKQIPFRVIFSMLRGGSKI